MPVSPRDLARVTGPGVIVIVRLPFLADLDRIAESAIAGGAGALEVTLNTPGALDWLPDAVHRFGDRLLLGAGTVLTGDDARRALAAGAQFLVSPHFDREVVAVAREAGVISMPAAYTPTEIVAAWQAGGDLIKLFPAGTGGARYLRDLRAPLDMIPLVPTGGVNEATAGDFIRAGAAALGLGSSVVNAGAVKDARYDEMTASMRRTIALVHEARADGDA